MDAIRPYLVFLVPITVGLGTQIVKFAIFTMKHGWKPEYMFTHGHMPSAHTAFAVSLAVSVGWYEGVTSGSFAVAAALAFVLVDDAARIRMYLGDQGRYLNMLVQQLDIDESKFPRLKERVGHRVSEVIVGGLIGLIATLVLAA
ncbi:MAG: divergent PAP2 family protein, partial [Candidatus Moranbacteria bacterium]|nr:divergent PAP2 family protein [Candidatus Moranbacteria bacterium]